MKNIKVMKNIHIISTDKPSRLQKFTDVDKIEFELASKNEFFNKGMNIYITNSEEIKERDWYINTFVSEREQKPQTHTDKKQLINHQKDYRFKYCKKIILTTDQDLIKDGVQKIDDEFLEWFVKNPSCEEVEVEEFEPIYGHQNNSSSILYKIIIPKEEPNYNMKKEILAEMMKQDEELGLYEETVEEYFLPSIKNMLQFNNDALAIRLMEKYYHAKKEQDETNNK